MAKIPAKDATILWSDEITNDPEGSSGARMRVTEVLVVDHMQMQPKDAARLDNSRGACDLDWLQGNWRMTPMGLFLEMAAVDGFVSQAVKIDALREFAKIEGEVWPEMLLRDLGIDVEHEG